MGLFRKKLTPYQLCEITWRILHKHLGNPEPLGGQCEGYYTPTLRFSIDRHAGKETFVLQKTGATPIRVDRRGAHTGDRAIDRRHGLGTVRSYCALVLRTLARSEVEVPIKQNDMRQYREELGLRDEG